MNTTQCLFFQIGVGSYQCWRYNYTDGQPNQSCFMKSNNPPFFHILLLSLVIYGCQPPESTSTPIQPPNIILIMADDLGMETLGCYGGESYNTPNLDLLAANGMRFDHAYSTPLCTPSRVQLMTGKYNFRNYIAFGLLDANETTFAHLLKDAGYETCIVGKWQLYGNERQQELAGGRTGTVPEDAGFDDWCLWQVKERGYRFKSPTLTIRDQGTKEYPNQYGPDMFVDYLLSFMEARKEKPFFIYYPMVLTHDPFRPTPNSDEYDNDDLHTVNDSLWFKDNVQYMDQMIARIVEKTKDLGVAENTIILFIGDNGTDRDVVSRWKGKHIQGQKGTTLEAGIHVPMIANWPGTITPGQVNDNLIDFTDFVPSLMDLAHIELPEDFTTDGLSFYSQLTAEAGPARDWVFGHYDPKWGQFEAKRYALDHRWKLYADGSFYDFNEDPLEKNPLDMQALDQEQQQALSKLQGALARFE